MQARDQSDNAGIVTGYVIGSINNNSFQFNTASGGLRVPRKDGSAVDTYTWTTIAAKIVVSLVNPSYYIANGAASSTSTISVDGDLNMGGFRVFSTNTSAISAN